MTLYQRLIERNDHEGETWNFWLQHDGNQHQIRLLVEYLETVEQDEHDPAFTLTADLLDDHDVDVLVRFGEDGYMAQHTKVSGRLTLPELFDPMPPAEDWLYKGGIKDWFTGDDDDE